MTQDIVERLNKRIAESDQLYGEQPSLIRDARDEIERLREYTANLRKRLEVSPDHAWDGIAERDREIERLRASEKVLSDYITQLHDGQAVAT